MAGALGSIASQMVGMAIGAQDGFNWNGFALGALQEPGSGPAFVHDLSFGCLDLLQVAFY
ncbi:hypothetical protein IGS59_25405 [Janthinobacterium sp. GW460P]|uniref:hypothetical protein n=1 Tax=unclassified Janthinobacterium TaxID=2610881 RepID=UPI000A320C07|nr:MULTISPECIES: hypothetical protein [unclassified Janthinobacterium]MCC7705583.1 hypothetical protein [Janthinobacterium sp. GW460P]MCC7711085.1 hypothetical protein [Janthinobacterium sp. GW460W]